MMQFLYLPDISSASSITSSARYDTEAQLLASLRGSSRVKVDAKLQALSERLESLRHLSSRLSDIHDITGGDRDDKFSKAVSKDQAERMMRILPTRKGYLRSLKIFFLKREKDAKAAKGQDEASKKPSVKTVTQIQKNIRSKMAIDFTSTTRKY
jgi:hypothetical protein